MSEFKGKERDVAVLLLKDRWSTLLLEDDRINSIAASMKKHIVDQYGATREEALKLLVELNCQALREVADQLEEMTALFLQNLKN